MAALDTIESKVWGISIIGTGVIAEGIASLRQCIDIILRTSLGTDPLRPLFGSNIYKYQDAPINIAIPNIKASIVEALRIWETRIKVQKINHYLADAGHVEFEVVYKLVDSGLIDKITFNPNVTSGSNQTGLILQAFFPPGVDIKRNNLNFTINNAAVLPAPPVYGFASVEETYAWVVTNWGSYGTWHLLADRIVCYLNPNNYVQAGLEMFLLTETRFATNIPPLEDNIYNIKFNPDNAGLMESYLLGGDAIITKEALLSFAVANWSSYGSWAIEYFVNPIGTFNSDFNDDFESQSDGYQLVLYSSTITTTLLEVESI